jgi:hypothetical protein
MVRFERRFFPARHYKLPLRWVFIALGAGLLVLILLFFRKLF